jgi:hypothetical protein
MPQSMMNFEEDFPIHMFLGSLFIFIIVSMKFAVIMLECFMILHQYPIMVYYILIFVLGVLSQLVIIVMIYILILWWINIINYIFQ